MEKNQYIISSKKISDVPQGFELRIIDKLYLYRHPDLEENFHQSNHVSVLLMGFIISPDSPHKTTKEIVESFTRFESKEDLFEAIENYSGRYVIVYQNEIDLIIFHDMFGQRQINYTRFDDELIISSSEKLLVQMTTKTPQYIPNSQELIHDKKFLFFDQWLLGDLTWDVNIKKLLPNHFIDFYKKQVKRLPLFDVQKMNEEEVISYCKKIIVGNYDAVLNRYETIYQALTSGYDSRTLLAFSKKHWKSIQFYTFNRGDVNSNRDDKTAKRLSKEFGFSHLTISKLKKDKDFEMGYKSQFLIARTTPKFYNILFFRKLNTKSKINLTGDGVQMVRNLRSPLQLESAETLFQSLGYGQHQFHLDNFSQWLEDAQLFSKANGILISDLFTQEIAQGQLTARWAHEFDLSGCEEFNPFNHKKMIYTILKNIPSEERISPNYSFHKKLMESVLPRISQIPFNPPTWKNKLKKLIGR